MNILIEYRRDRLPYSTRIWDADTGDEISMLVSIHYKDEIEAAAVGARLRLDLYARTAGGAPQVDHELMRSKIKTEPYHCDVVAIVTADEAREAA